MSKEKQTEEIAMTTLDVLANDINQHCPDLKEDYCGDTHCTACLANALYNAGYRKQKVGRWVHNEDRSAYEAEYFCSECLADGNNDGDEPFCWNCGAKMKGGAE